jgi:hypothetical protein
MRAGGMLLASAAVLLMVVAMPMNAANVSADPSNVPFLIVGQTISGNQSLMLGGDVSGVMFMDVTLEGRQVGNATQAPFMVWIDTTEFCDGVHNLTVKIGYEGGAVQVIQTSVTVDNQNWPLTLVALPIAALAGMLLLFTLTVGLARRKKGGEK